MLKTMRPVFLALCLAVTAVTAAPGQSNQFRDTRAHLGVAVGLFTYHGPIDLLRPRTNTNFVRENDPGVAVLGSFPITRDRFFFRAMVGFTNFSTSDGERLVARENGQNEFLTRHILWFEPEVVMTLTKGSRSRFLPYVFTGFGGMLANPFGRTDRIDVPGSGVPGPERSVFTLPVGIGFDYALSPSFSFFLEGSYRFDLNYVLRNERTYNRHDTSFLLAGLRIGLKNPFRKVVDRPGPLPPPMPIPDYAPPLPAPPPQTCPLALVELNTVFFDYDSVVLSDAARALLDENVEALGLYGLCCVEIKGYTDRTPDAAYARRIARERAEAVYRYYVRQGVPAERLHVRAEGERRPACGKDRDGIGCRDNRRVESTPVDCAAFR